MYQKLVRLFELKRDAALLLYEMDFKGHASTETLVLTAFAATCESCGEITNEEYSEIHRMVNEFCDQLQ